MKRRALSLLALLAACGEPVPLSAPDGVAAPDPAPAGAPAPEEAALARLDAPGRVVAIGDLHGDLAATRAALRLAGAIDEADRWVGGDLVLVQGGDQLDRGDDEPQILALFERLQTEAAAAGGAVVVLNGNHELMNAAGDLRYVTSDGLVDYGGPDARREAFAPGGELARALARRPIFAIVEDTLFTHAAVSPEHVELGLGRLDAEARAWLRGERPEPPPVYRDSDGPLWSRRYAREVVDASDCEAARVVMERLGVSRMVIGHTPQPHVNAVCDGRVWRVDVGLARHYGGPVEVLLIEDGVARPLTAASP